MTEQCAPLVYHSINVPEVYQSVLTPPGLYPSLLRLCAAHFPHLCLVEDWLRPAPMPPATLSSTTGAYLCLGGFNKHVKSWPTECKFKVYDLFAAILIIMKQLCSYVLVYILLHIYI